MSLTRKEFALFIKDKYWEQLFFNLFSNKCATFKEFIQLNKSKTGEYTNSFLDTLLKIIL